DGRATLNHAAAIGIAFACIQNDPIRGHLAGALPVEEIARIHSIEEEAVTGVALSIGPDWRVAQTGVRSCTAVKLGIDTRRQNRESSEAARGQRDRVDLRSF